MADLVPADQIEQIVGARRHAHQHLGRAASAEQTVYVLHSEKCRDSGIDLRECEWSLALDRGIDLDDWSGHEDRAVVLAFRRGRLFPVFPRWLDDLVLAAAGRRVHNHPPYRPACNERRLDDGQLRGACLNDDGSDRG